MNAAIRSVTRSASYFGLEVLGIKRGFEGLIGNSMVPMDATSVSNIIQHGGTTLKSARSEAFRTREGRQQAADNLKANGIDGLIAIGGNGTFRGCRAFAEEHGLATLGIPGTIDNDLSGTDYTLGYDTAVNTALEAVDRIRDTADSHNRLFFIEVMGRDAGFIAMNVGLGGGAEGILIPESERDFAYAVKNLQQGWQREKTSSIIVVAEGNESGGVFDIVNEMKPLIPDFEYRVSILGHIQRGGSPTAMDRVLGSRLGYAAVEGLLNGEREVMAGLVNHQITFSPFDQCAEVQKTIDPSLLKLAEILST